MYDLKATDALTRSQTEVSGHLLAPNKPLHVIKCDTDTHRT